MIPIKDLEVQYDDFANMHWKKITDLIFLFINLLLLIFFLKFLIFKIEFVYSSKKVLCCHGYKYLSYTSIFP